MMDSWWLAKRQDAGHEPPHPTAELSGGSRHARAQSSWSDCRRSFATGCVAGAAALLALAACGPSKGAYQAALDKNEALLKRNDQLRLQVARQALAEVDRRADCARFDQQASRDEARAARMASLRKFVESVRRALGPRGIEVTIRHGRMLVSVPEAVLFASGQTDLRGDAREVLDQMARFIKEAGRSFRVTGYTDNVPIKTKRFESNWELSTARALEVVHHLIGQGVDPDKLAAVGRADTEPVGDNATAAGRATNRRIELVLEPDLAELPDLSAALQFAAAP